MKYHVTKSNELYNGRPETLHKCFLCEVYVTERKLTFRRKRHMIATLDNQLIIKVDGMFESIIL